MRRYLLSIFLLGAAGVHAQTDTSSADGQDLEAMLSDPAGTKKHEYVTATFKATRLVTGHSVETLGAGILDFRINHRFGAVNSGIRNFFGLDGAVTRIGFDYGVTRWFTVGLGRSTYQKEVDGFAKIKLLRQTEDNVVPFSLVYVGGMSVRTDELSGPNGADYPTSNRLFYSNQALIARKFNDWLSLQLMPTHIHYNLVSSRDEPNNVFAMGVGGRVKLSRRISFNAEYYYTLPGAKLNGVRNALALGIDIETGGHVFQLHFTNSTGMSERTYIGQTADNWGDGAIHFGFNISRVFTIVRPKGFDASRNKIW